MATEAKPLDQLIKELPAESQAKVRQFVESLLEKQTSRSRRYIRQTWAGALKDHREEFTSIILQSKSLDWRSNH